ncbi:MAG: sigma-70 region 4 domain-containing protein [Candidatus Thiodiazotropha sp. (ex Cardiolucina cf. quadrata)]|nr:sigma-70 region 4 domain-containing protein [Candidatus Thiodiazotropha sp. (ex Cardiolucina cf. quadrata)]
MEGDIDNELLSAIENLPQHLRAVAQMHFVENNSYTEISQQLSITQANARKRVQLAREIINNNRE